MKSICKRALVLTGSSFLGATLWLAVFIAAVVGSAHFEDIGVMNGSLVAGGGFLLAGAVGIASAFYVLRRFRPWAISK
jgi:hypothetical protein